MKSTNKFKLIIIISLLSLCVGCGTPFIKLSNSEDVLFEYIKANWDISDLTLLHNGADGDTHMYLFKSEIFPDNYISFNVGFDKDSGDYHFINNYSSTILHNKFRDYFMSNSKMLDREFIMLNTNNQSSTNSVITFKDKLSNIDVDINIYPTLNVVMVVEEYEKDTYREIVESIAQFPSGVVDSYAVNIYCVKPEFIPNMYDREDLSAFLMVWCIPELRSEQTYGVYKFWLKDGFSMYNTSGKWSDF